ncbi:putative polysaccharide biosynthesis protein [Phosphitispora fastidiosa]|uniref:putative polysaccharide biosynthesis protein n=1 Tax=Phosphitispora fastidiosa TaxID=2837202 RepID=UPI001E29B663|nr:polysaccharide biosynthesis protein [Phosphitispora fastidiosa]MBU7005364.1 stage V sporulation protein B [Phosphitispora fastidiosa]
MKRSFVHGALVLMAAATVNRVIGFIYQAAIYRLIGPEGVGLYNLVYPVYILIIVLTTAGIPLGISKLVSEAEVTGNRRLSYQVLWLSLIILIVSGGFFTVISYMASPLLLKHVFVNKMVYPVFRCLLPGIFIVSLSSAFRGFFQGLMDMKPPAVSQVVEQVIRVFFGISLAVYLLPRGIQWAAAGIAGAGVIGELFGLTVLITSFVRRKPLSIVLSLPGITASYNILRKLFKMCTPITLGRIAATLMLSIDSMLIPYVLREAGHSTSAATAIYGQLTGVALTLLSVPSVITVSLATSLVPAISEAVAQNRCYVVSSRTSEAIRVTLLAAVPFVSAFMILPDAITQAIFGSSEAGQLLAILAFGGLFAYLQQTTTGVLQGLGYPVIPLRNMIVAGFVKILGIYTISSRPSLGINAIAYCFDVFFILAAGLNILSLYRKTGCHINIKNDVFKPVTAGLLTAMIYSGLYKLLHQALGLNFLSVIVSLGCGFVFYIFAVALMGSLKKNDLRKLPYINRLIR